MSPFFSFSKIKKKFVHIVIDKDKTLHENLEDHGKVECPICNREIIPYWEFRYNGIRATCDICEVNWSES